MLMVIATMQTVIRIENIILLSALSGAAVSTPERQNPKSCASRISIRWLRVLKDDPAAARHLLQKQAVCACIQPSPFNSFTGSLARGTGPVQTLNAVGTTDILRAYDTVF